MPVSSEEEALDFIEEIRKKYWDARHHCFAYIIGDGGRPPGAATTGSRPQTAGKPMMDVLAGAELHDVCAVVTRYFGGTLLGTGDWCRRIVPSICMSRVSTKARRQPRADDMRYRQDTERDTAAKD